MADEDSSLLDRLRVGDSTTRHELLVRRQGKLPDDPPDIEELMSRDHVLAALTDSLSGVPAGLRPVLAAHIRLTVGTGHLVTGKELAKPLRLDHTQADHQLDLARNAMGQAIAAHIATKIGRPCDSLADHPLDPAQTTHAETCPRCAERRQDAHDYARWLLGPGLLGLAENDENRRAALAFFSRTTEFSAPRTGILGSVGARVANLPGIRALTRAAQENPAVVRVTAGAIGLVAAAVIAVLATARDRPAIALPPPTPPLTGTYGAATTIPPVTTTTGSAPPTVPLPPRAGAVPVVVTATTTTSPTSAPPSAPPTAVPRPYSPPTNPPRIDLPDRPPADSQADLPAPASGRWAYARVEPADSPVGTETDLIGTWQWGTAEPIKVTRLDTGVYRLRLPGLASYTAVAHATVTFHQPPRPVGCVVRDNRPVGGDQVVTVACADDGTPVNARFNFVLAEQTTKTVVIRPDTLVRRLAPGLYEADVAGFTGNGYVQVTPYGPDPVRCQPGGVRDGAIRVRCTADTRWAATYIEDAPPAGTIGAYAQTTGTAPDLRIDPTRSYHSSGGTFSLNRLGPGRYRVLLNGISGGTVLSGATDTGFCYTFDWNTSPEPANEVSIDVQCLDDAGNPADLRFGVAAYREPPDPGERLDPLQPAAPTQVTAPDAKPRTSRLAAGDAHPPPATVRLEVRCHDQAGRPADASAGSPTRARTTAEGRGRPGAERPRPARLNRGWGSPGRCRAGGAIGR